MPRLTARARAFCAILLHDIEPVILSVITYKTEHVLFLLIFHHTQHLLYCILTALQELLYLSEVLHR